MNLSKYSPFRKGSYDLTTGHPTSLTLRPLDRTFVSEARSCPVTISKRVSQEAVDEAHKTPSYEQLWSKVNTSPWGIQEIKSCQLNKGQRKQF